MIRPAVLALFSLALAAPLVAQNDGDPYAACAAMTADAERLACFDTTHAQRATARAEAMAQAAVRAEREFGLAQSGREEPGESETAASEADRADAEDGEITIAAMVAEASLNDVGRNTVVLDNGQVWREISGSNMRVLPRAGWQARVTQSWSGGYQMRFDGRRGFLRVMRVR